MAFKNHAFRHECRQRATCLFVISWVWFDPVRPGGAGRSTWVRLGLLWSGWVRLSLIWVCFGFGSPLLLHFGFKIVQKIFLTRESPESNLLIFIHSS